ncbi:MAG: Uma2 family endonuclease [Clostridia bacterium]|nr:MAG: Uma2 family endonuclease [Clostridia bacterium]
MFQPTPPAGRILLTYEDYCALPNDGKRYEILEGVLHVAPAPNIRHQRVSRRLELILALYVEANQLGEVFDAPVDVVLSPHNVAQPDLIFVSRGRSQCVTEKNIAGSPDLVVEILSPSTALVDRLTKSQIYARHGVDYYWLVDPDGETLEEYQRQGEVFVRLATYQGATVCATRCFPDLSLDLTRVWGA